MILLVMKPVRSLMKSLRTLFLKGTSIDGIKSFCFYN